MKKIEGQSKGNHYPSANIYKDDLLKIIEILEEICDEVEISDDEYEYDSLEELEQEKGIRPKKISITGRSPHVSIDLKPRSIWLYRSSSDQKSVYAYKSIEDIILKRKNLISILFNKSVGIISCIILFIFLATMPVETIKTWFPDRLSRLLFLLVLIGTPMISFFNGMGSFSFITLRKSHEDGSFFDRNKDDIVKIIIGAIAGAIVTWVLTKFLGK